MNWKDRTAYAFIKTKKGSAHQVWERFQSWDNVIGTWVVTGEYDVVAWFDAKDWDTIHDCIATIKQWDEVEDTNTHMVHQGYKTNRWWWEKPVGAWMLMKENQLDESVNRVSQWDWITSGASIPGDWDYMAWVEGENWDDVWNHLMDVKTGDWRTAALVPIKSWWNQDFKDKWWQESNPSSQVGIETTENQQMY
ncbi:MAG: Lrp/AsnC ligand binding domain-containing protein [Thermoplasmatota archaeon]